MALLRTSLHCSVIFAWMIGAACNADYATPTSPASIRSSNAFHTVAGKVLDPNLAPVSGAVITAPDGQQAISGAQGDYVIRADNNFTTFTVERQGYEPRTFATERTSADITLDLTLQPRITMDNRSVSALTLSSRDLPYYVADPYDSDYCRPCKMIRLQTAAGSDVRIELTWNGNEPLALWLRGQRVETTTAGHAATTISGTGEEMRLHVGRPYPVSETPMQHDVAFRLATSPSQ